ncbi:lipoprotein-releasing ABC transporter permease subunit LolE [Pantoea sp. JGM49]|jgi:lipoprotein-releasing system permease protein|uniref:Outer membrane-specific lipoprotein transporter subunit LolE n=2 Tax=Pantoea TaxID=53335 RepID=A0ABM5RKP5_9GAMM|nr:MULTISPECIES: lipoprotein-releasing ABC transporter permease subunit LolE [Erwiniaceae]HAU5565050.1 lipoprotein-releasing ABC transporter permease subunit LolE [Serratia fonticola]AIR86638.1 outer membrane-specific lipoprotein transporter subunit LolE [Pantoea rwandensis]KJV34972.1 outer membrane-specific lipoprotein transporter subunit LolE [Pantoea sp. SM3]KJV48033.1 outer membrane-specific lipoprotein transporter subunit LolE [Pantoea sp. BL1]MBK0090512.1 lipoprotein-releasing ABC transp
MGSSLSLLLGLRFSRGRRRGGMVSLISIISTIGIALGVAVLIIGLSAMNGFERELNKRILAVVPHGEIEPVNQPFRNWQPMIAPIEKVPGIAAAAPYINFTGLIESGAKMQALQVKGVDPQQESRLSALPSFVDGDAWQQFGADKQQIILGGGIAKSLNVKQGDWITIMIPNNDGENKLLQPKRIRLQVSGILQLSGMLDHSLALVPLADAQKYLDMGDSVSGIALKMSDPFQAQKLVRDAGEATHSYVYIKSWIGTYGYMYRDIQMIRAIMYLAMVLVIGVACFNIVSTLVMAVKDKSSDIAVLRTLGAKDGLIRAIFIWYGLLAGLLGSISGVVVGVLVALNLTPIVRGLEHLTGHQLLAGDIYFIDFLPSELHWIDVISVLVTAILLSLIASWYPARRASRIDPARVLSGQ